MNPNETLDSWLKKNNVVEVECLIHDMTGNARGKLMSVDKMLGYDQRLPESLLLQAVTGEFCDAHDELVSPNDQDMRIVPDASSVRLVPWNRKPTAQVIHDCLTHDGSKLHSLSSRNVLKRVLAAYKEAGLTAVLAPEVECYLINKSVDSTNVIIPPIGTSGRRENVRKSYSIDAMYEFDGFLETVNNYCRIMDLDIDSMIHEEGAAQLEINFFHGDPLSLADQVTTLKRALRQAAMSHDMHLTFMAKPMDNEPGSSMHIHQSILNTETGKNIFINEDGTKSDAFFHYIAGLQKYTPDLLSFYAPNVNSYRRYVKDSSVPNNMHWGYDNRTTGIRIPDAHGEATRVENRFSGIDANTYLAFAVSLASGLVGIQKKLQPTEPYKGNAGMEESTLSRTLVDAVSGLEGLDEIADLLGRDFIRAYREIKLSEFDEFDKVVTSWEREYLLLTV